MPLKLRSLDVRQARLGQPVLVVLVVSLVLALVVVGGITFIVMGSTDRDEPVETTTEAAPMLERVDPAPPVEPDRPATEQAE